MIKIIKTGLVIAVTLVLSVMISYASSKFGREDGNNAFSVNADTGLFNQKIVESLNEPIVTYHLYQKNQLLGIVSDKMKMEALLNEVYQRDYANEFPQSRLGFISDIYYAEDLSYNKYENKDQEIFDYIHKQELLAIEVNRIEFSNGAIIYVKSLEDFENAKASFIKSYVSDEAYNAKRLNEKVTPLKDYGSKDVDFSIQETVTISKGFASIENILLRERDILSFLSFGYEPAYETYTVQEYDTIEGVSFLNRLSINQLLSINNEVLLDTNQFLKPGMNLNVTSFNSPFTVVVTKERKTEEIVYPEQTIYQNDPTLREGLTEVVQEEVYGARDVTYRDTYRNDIPDTSEEVNSVTTKSPVRGVIKVGTLIEPKIGSGKFRYPMDNARISCGWYCYAGHRAIDMQANSNGGYGPIYAVDRGVVEERSYDGTRGYYIIINHNNGFRTMYFHMESPGYIPVGVTVRKGEQIGYVGMTGKTTGPHVHLVIEYLRENQNPCNYLGC